MPWTVDRKDTYSGLDFIVKSHMKNENIFLRCLIIIANWWDAIGSFLYFAFKLNVTRSNSTWISFHSFFYDPHKKSYENRKNKFYEYKYWRINLTLVNNIPLSTIYMNRQNSQGSFQVLKVSLYYGFYIVLITLLMPIIKAN